MEYICICCLKKNNTFEACCSAIPPAGIYANGEFICDDCIKKYFYNNNDLFNILYQYRKIKNTFYEELFNAVKFYLREIFNCKRITLNRTLKERVLQKYGYTCCYCGTSQNLSIDHIIPYSKNGSDEMDNLQVLCKSCNSKKGAKI